MKLFKPQIVSVCRVIFAARRSCCRAVSGWVSVTLAYCVETAKYGHSCCGMRIGNRTQAFELYDFQWHWVTTKLHFKFHQQTQLRSLSATAELLVLFRVIKSQRERLNALGLSFCLSVDLSFAKMQKCDAISSKTKQFRAMVSIYDLEVIHGLFKEPIIGPLKSVGGAIWIKFRRLAQNDMSTAVTWSTSKPEVEFQYGGRGRLGEFNGMSSQSNVFIAGWQNSIRHIENPFSPYFIFCFPNAVWASNAGAG